ncbi:MAG TPA: TetR family transcriptional regulator [Gaiellaceae bacterium]|nr:TetR family transcriptional regulator [Gaiellaceae bacterium]
MQAVAALNRDRIIAKAIELADRDGLDAVTLRRIAGELGVHVTSLYNHVPTRDAVTTGIVDALVTGADLPVEEIGWEAWVRAFVAAVGEIAVEHPGAFVALQRRPVEGAQATRSFEVALAAFERAGLDAVGAYGAVKATTYVALSIAVERALSSRGDGAETAVTHLPAESFPHVHALGSGLDPETTWAFSVDTLVAGLRAQITGSSD